MSGILIIENDASTIKIFVENLNKLGLKVAVAQNSIIGIEIAQRKLPDLIICSIQILKKDGHKFFNAIYANFITAIIPVIFLIEEASDIDECIELAADGYIHKLCTADELNKAIKAQLLKQAARKHRYAIQSQKDLTYSSTIDCDKPNVESILPNIPRLNKVFEFIASNYDQAISLCDVAKALGYSPNYLTTIVSQMTGKSLQKWIIECRMIAAQTLLLETNQPVIQVALKIGYDNPAHFYRQFRYYYGMSPQTWRKAQHCHPSQHQTTAKEYLVLSEL